MRELVPISVAVRPDFTRFLGTPVSRETWSTIGGDVTAAVKLVTKDLGPLAPLYWLELAPPRGGGGARVAVAWYCLVLTKISPTTSRAATAGTAMRMFFRRLRMSR